MVDAAIIKKTQDSLGKVIKKPPLTEKLLSKPPFRYLHDIISEVCDVNWFVYTFSPLFQKFALYSMFYKLRF